MPDDEPIRAHLARLEAKIDALREGGKQTMTHTRRWPGLLIRCQTIADYCGVSQRTIRRWRQFHKFPMFHLPDGRLATSKPLVDQWCYGQIEEEGYEPWGAKWKRQEHTASRRRTRDEAREQGKQSAP